MFATRSKGHRLLGALGLTTQEQRTLLGTRTFLGNRFTCSNKKLLIVQLDSEFGLCEPRMALEVGQGPHKQRNLHITNLAQDYIRGPIGLWRIIFIMFQQTLVLQISQAIWNL